MQVVRGLRCGGEGMNDAPVQQCGSMSGRGAPPAPQAAGAGGRARGAVREAASATQKLFEKNIASKYCIARLGCILKSMELDGLGARPWHSAPHCTA
ncbi:unnamed protein product, partial [Iphiclides podalirius]